MSFIELKDGRKLVQKINRNFPIYKEDDGDNAIIAIVSSESVDSYGDIIRQKPSDKGGGWQLKRFNKSPVMLWAHDIMRPSLGGGAATLGEHKDLGDVLLFRPDFDQEDPIAEVIEGKVRRNVISETSVGFVSLIDEKMSDGGYEFFEQELLEISWVNRGANPDTATFVKSIFDTRDDLARLIPTNDDNEIEELKNAITDLTNEMNERMREIERVIIHAWQDYKELPGNLERDDLIRELSRRLERFKDH